MFALKSTLLPQCAENLSRDSCLSVMCKLVSCLLSHYKSFCAGGRALKLFKYYSDAFPKTTTSFHNSTFNVSSVLVAKSYFRSKWRSPEGQRCDQRKPFPYDFHAQLISDM